jgi:hypothetical protein
MTWITAVHYCLPIDRYRSHAETEAGTTIRVAFITLKSCGPHGRTTELWTGGRLSGCQLSDRSFMISLVLIPSTTWHLPFVLLSRDAVVL